MVVTTKIRQGVGTKGHGRKEEIEITQRSLAGIQRPRLKVNGKGVPLRSQAEEALQCYFETLNGHKPAHLYDLVMREVEEPLFKVVMGHVQGNQSRAATILGINRGTLRKKLKEFGIHE
jgi:Fis family transcriptional regulator